MLKKVLFGLVFVVVVGVILVMTMKKADAAPPVAAGNATITEQNQTAVQNNLQFSNSVSHSNSSSVSGATAVTGSTSNNSVTIEENHPDSLRIKQAPAMAIPDISPTSPCMGTFSAGISNIMGGIGGGKSYEAIDCNYRETARLLAGLGHKDAAIEVLCQSKYVSESSICAPYRKAEVVVADPKQKDLVARTSDGKGWKSGQSGQAIVGK